jgi:hypothetical protein
MQTAEASKRNAIVAIVELAQRMASDEVQIYRGEGGD